MCIHVLDQSIAGLPVEPRLLNEVTIRLATEADQPRFDQYLTKEHYLKNPTVVGRVLRYIAQYQGQWVALLVFSSPAYHLKARDRWLGWSPRQVQEWRHWLAQKFTFSGSGTDRPVAQSGLAGFEAGLSTVARGLAKELRRTGAGGRELCRSRTGPGHLLSGGGLGAAGADPGL